MKSILLNLFTFGTGAAFSSWNSFTNKKQLKAGFYRLEHDDLIFEMSVTPSGQIEERWKSTLNSDKKFVFIGVNQLKETQTPAYCLDGEMAVIENDQMKFRNDFIKLKVSKENQPLNIHNLPYVLVGQTPEWTV
ncbi:hypothetical protein [Flammeovirga aprica]|uniref:Uncharacterized protein n=1 Tax=Flammeovirga aprica JL-4 TaxID=694437 RepID=A0A7X9XAU8_9BACT|nr:hypothetical protein [Flammeovirga aprica]NME69989.1 hypothetical protein [Flammeovirga aprica JL-4]